MFFPLLLEARKRHLLIAKILAQLSTKSGSEMQSSMIMDLFFNIASQMLRGFGAGLEFFPANGL